MQTISFESMYRIESVNRILQNVQKEWWQTDQFEWSYIEYVSHSSFGNQWIYLPPTKSELPTCQVDPE